MTATTAARGTMPLAGHVREARRRAIRAAVALLIGTVIGYLLSDQVLDVLRSPIEEIAQYRQASLNYETVTGAFDLKIKIALFSGVVLSSPVWLLELFAFLAPGLTKREKNYTVGFALTAIPLFVAGGAFGFLLFPHMVEMLAGFSSDEDTTILTASYYVDFVMKIVLALGVAFVLPVFVVMLNFLGVVSSRTIRRSWRLIVVVITLFSALVTPAADVLSMFLVAVPMSVLFTTAVVITQLHDRREVRRAIAPDQAALSKARDIEENTRVRSDVREALPRHDHRRVRHRPTTTAPLRAKARRHGPLPTGLHRHDTKHRPRPRSASPSSARTGHR